jgi:hypothetical protein
MPRRQTQAERDRYIDNKKIDAYQLLVVALSDERKAIETYGAFSTQAREAEQDTRKAKRSYELWRKK